MINQYKSPKDKISTIINFCNILSAMIINSPKKDKEKYNSINTDENENSKLAGADEVLPIVVYALLQGNIRKIKSNINYIKLFRHHSMFDSNKEEYFTTVLQSGIEFIDKLNKDVDLKIDKEEMVKLIKENEKRIKKERFESVQEINSRNADLNYLVYYLTGGSQKEKEDEPSELDEFKANSVRYNVSSSLSKDLIGDKKGIFKLDLNKLYDEYFNKDLKNMPLSQIEKMFNDFKITLLLLNNYIENQ